VRIVANGRLWYSGLGQRLAGVARSVKEMSGFLALLGRIDQQRSGSLSGVERSAPGDWQGVDGASERDGLPGGLDAVHELGGEADLGRAAHAPQHLEAGAAGSKFAVLDVLRHDVDAPPGASAQASRVSVKRRGEAEADAEDRPARRLGAHRRSVDRDPPGARPALAEGVAPSAARPRRRRSAVRVALYEKFTCNYR
jgi:hypothetical protein